MLKYRERRFISTNDMKNVIHCWRMRNTPNSILLAHATCKPDVAHMWCVWCCVMHVHLFSNFQYNFPVFFFSVAHLNSLNYRAAAPLRYISFFKSVRDRIELKCKYTHLYNSNLIKSLRMFVCKRRSHGKHLIKYK